MRALKRIALVFHLNQLTGPYIRTAASTSYRALLETLRDHPTLPIHLHVSGTLLAGLAWYAPDVLDLIRQGVSTGQFELLGSTYAQNIPESTPSACNDLQLAAHREQLERAFGARPAGFWNPERCWSESYLALLARSGYRFTLLETGTLAAAGLATHMPHRVMSGEASVHLVPDDPGFRAAVNLALWSGDRRAVEERLDALPDGGLLVHAEDAEALGLWAFERGWSPATDRENFARLLGWLSNNDDVEVIHLSRSLTATAPVKLPPVKGQADWMVRALADRALPFHEDGYADWFDFNARAPRLAHVRALHADVTRVLLATAQSLKAPVPAPARRLVELGREALAACQYELGCVGIGEVSWPAWELARAALLLIHAAVRAARADVESATAGSEVLDRDRDGVPEIFLTVGSDLVILTPVGGRVLAWIDLQNGDVLGGAALGLTMPGPFRSVAHPFSGPVPLAPVWSPPRAAPARREVPAADAWFARLVQGHLPDLARTRATLEPLPVRDALPSASTLRRVGVFADEIGGALNAEVHAYTAGTTEVTFHTPTGDKVIRLARGLLTAEYPAGFGGGLPVTVRCELLPDRRQRTAPSGPPLRLDASDTALAIEINARPEPASGLWEEIPLAWVAGVTYVPPGSGLLPAFRLELTRYP